MQARTTLTLSSLVLPLLLGACAMSPASPAAIRASLAPIHDPQKFCFYLVYAKHLADLSGEEKVRYVSCVADPDPFLWNYAPSNPTTLHEVLARSARVESITRAVLKAKN